MARWRSAFLTDNNKNAVLLTICKWFFLKPEMDCYKEEIFGPVLITMNVDTLDEVNCIVRSKLLPPPPQLDFYSPKDFKKTCQMLTSNTNWTKGIDFHVTIAVLVSKETEVVKYPGLRRTWAHDLRGYDAQSLPSVLLSNTKTGHIRLLQLTNF